MKTIIRTIRTAFFMLMAGLFAGHAQAQSFCFASAGSYYEQVYCELQARGEAKNLPPFYQFKRNDARTQALLLKRPASRIGIDLPMPKAAVASRPSPTKPAAPSTIKPAQKPPVASALVTESSSASRSVSGCQLKGEELRCGEQRFVLVGNRRNQRLAQGVLDADNRMAIPAYDGDINDQSAVDAYLARAYRQYIEKMHEIGLGGVTMTYGKFHFLFFDLQEKGLDFSQRFETMYGFLKKDKATMGVSETVSADAELTAGDCDALADHLWVCSRAGRNYLYLAQSE